MARVLQREWRPPKTMISLPSPHAPAMRATRSRLFRGLSLLATISALSSPLWVQAQPNPDAPAGADANANGGRGRRGQNGQNGGNGGGQGNFDPAQIQQRLMDNLREQFGVTDDAEWKLISDRITAVTELRRTAGGAGGGFGGFRGGQGGPGGQGGQRGQGGPGGGRGGPAASPEQDALRQALTDKLPDAEIKSRLARLREVRKATEEKLTKAQEELRAVLGMRQEAAAVMAGLLP